MNINQRIDALDILRGLALAGMLLVNNPGSWSHVYWPLLHAPWNGLTPTDLVFPFFLFVVGSAMAYSFKDKLESRHFAWLKISRRASLLILIGILLSAIPYQQALSEWRLLGVLQRIGLCYLICAVLIRCFTFRQLIIVGVLTLFAYPIALFVFSANPYSIEDNLVRHIDLTLLGASHMWKGLGLAFDPEGLLSTLPAAMSCLSGYLITLHIMHISKPIDKVKHLVSVGAFCVVVALLISPIDPINKSLWTSSYVLITSGIACLVLAFIIVCWDIYQFRIGFNALKVYGSNTILLFVLAGIVARALSMIPIHIDGRSLAIKPIAFEWLTQFMPAKIASFSFAIMFMLSFYFLAWVLYKRSIFIKL
jgi:predicted acyltransferase